MERGIPLKYSLLTLVVLTQTGLNAFAQNDKLDIDSTKVSREFHFRELKTRSLGECQTKIFGIIDAFRDLEWSVQRKVLNEENINALLPWIKASPAGWQDFSEGIPVDVESITQTSPALVQIEVQNPDENTPYTRFEDFKSPPVGTNDAVSFQLGQNGVSEEICLGVTSGARGRVGSNGFYYDQYKYDIVAQASLFSRYVRESTDIITKVGQLETFSEELKQLQKVVEDFRRFALEMRKAKVL